MKKLTKIYYKKLFNLGNFQHEEIGLETEFKGKPKQPFLNLKREVEALHQLSIEESEITHLEYKSKRVKEQIDQYNQLLQDLSKLEKQVDHKIKELEEKGFFERIRRLVSWRRDP